MTTHDADVPPEDNAPGGTAVSALPRWIERAADEEPFDEVGPDTRYRRAYLMAKTAHAGQKDKVGRDYFAAHVLRVTARAVFLAPDHLAEQVAVVALLHDVVEDTTVTLDDIAREFDEQTRDDVDAVTHRVLGTLPPPHRMPRWESYPKLIGRAVQRPVSLIVKTADNRINYEGLSEIPDPAVRKHLTEKYVKAYRRLWPAYQKQFGQQPQVVEVQWENEVGDRR